MERGKQYRVKAHALYLRNEPRIAEGTRIALLPQGHVVASAEEQSADDWLRVTTRYAGSLLSGFVKPEFLEPAPAAPGTVPAVHLPNPGVAATRRSKHWVYALNEPEAPMRSSAATRDPQLLTSIVEWLGVEDMSHARYWPMPNSTFCNIYAHDYCFLAGAYLPRVWWKERAIHEWLAGRSVPVQYAASVDELSANVLFAWLAEWGDDFGWRRSFDPGEAQRAANDGQVVVMSGARANRNEPGHITVVVPEIDAHKAGRANSGAVLVPLQSQAGRINRKYHSDDWGTASAWLDRGIWIHN